MCKPFNQQEKDIDYYAVLGVSSTATDKEIRKAYLMNARKVHPDKQDDVNCLKAKADFQKLNNAYETLKDPEKRRVYDYTRNMGSSNSSSTGGGFGSSSYYYSSSTSQGGSSTPSQPKSSAGYQEYSKPSGNTYSKPSGYQQEKTSYTSGAGYSYNNGNWWESYSNNTYQRTNYARTSESTRTGGYTNTNGGYTSTNSSNPHQQSEPKKTPGDGYHSSAHHDHARHTPPPPPPPPKASYHQSHSHSSQTNSSYHQNKPKTSTSTTSSSTTTETHRSRVYGIRKGDGLPCQRCIRQGCYCYQHKDQDPTVSSSSHTKSAPHSNDASKRDAKQKVYGIRKDGQPCKRCIKQGCFCYQHK